MSIDKDLFYSGPLGKAWGADEAPKCAQCGGMYFAGLTPETLCGKCRPAPAAPAEPTDRELIEFAAKAAGKRRPEWDAAHLRDLHIDISGSMLWNPLVDKGATLVLALQLGIQVWRDNDLLWVGGRSFVIAEGDDVSALACLEVTRAAYEIGKAMP